MDSPRERERETAILEGKERFGRRWTLVVEALLQKETHAVFARLTDEERAWVVQFNARGSDA